MTLRVTVDRPTTNLSVRLVDYGTAARVNSFNSLGGVTRLDTESCWGESSATDDACYFDTAEDVVTSDHAVITRGWTETSGSTVTIAFQPHDFVIAAGHVLGLVVSQTDNDYTSGTSTGATMTVDLSGSRLTLPVAGPARLNSPDGPPRVTTASDAPLAEHRDVIPR